VTQGAVPSAHQSPAREALNHGETRKCDGNWSNCDCDTSHIAACGLRLVSKNLRRTGDYANRMSPNGREHQPRKWLLAEPGASERHRRHSGDKEPRQQRKECKCADDASCCCVSVSIDQLDGSIIWIIVLGGTEALCHRSKKRCSGSQPGLKPWVSRSRPTSISNTVPLRKFSPASAKRRTTNSFSLGSHRGNANSSDEGRRWQSAEFVASAARLLGWEDG
jgi:hypothetical protein